jgi:hypothetical protein
VTSTNDRLAVCASPRVAENCTVAQPHLSVILSIWVLTGNVLGTLAPDFQGLKTGSDLGRGDCPAYHIAMSLHISQHLDH